MGRSRFAGQSLPLVDAEAVLFIGDDEPQIGERHAVLQDSVGADQQADVAVSQGGDGFSPLFCARRSGQKRHSDAGPFK